MDKQPKTDNIPDNNVYNPLPPADEDLERQGDG